MQRVNPPVSPSSWVGSRVGALATARFSLAAAFFLLACDGTAAKREVTPDSEPPPAAMPPAVPPTDPIENAGPCALQITEVALYQGVKIPLAVLDPMNGLVGAPTRTADVVAGRPALVRVFATPSPEWQGTGTVRLTLTSAAGTQTFDATNDLRRSSNDLRFDSTFNFQVPGDALREDSGWRIDVVSPAACAPVAAARFPSVDGALALSARATGVLKVVIVPIQYNTDTSGRLPDVSEGQLQRYRDLVVSMYPVATAELTLREPVGTELGITGQSGWEDLLDALRRLRQQDRAPADVHYYGVISPAASFSTYCGRACTAGIAYVSKDRQPALRVGVGVGFTGQFAAQTFAHELGHQDGRLHAPCNVDGDPDYPHRGGGVGVWGYDRASNRIIDPSGFTDIMGYCSPQWVSDFTYQGLLEHLAGLGNAPSVQALKTERTWKVLLVSPEGQPRWGHPLTSSEGPTGDAETAAVFDEAGRPLTTITVHRTALADSGSVMFWVPEPKTGWASVQVQGASPHRFDAPIATPVLR